MKTFLRSAVMAMTLAASAPSLAAENAAEAAKPPAGAPAPEAGDKSAALPTRPSHPIELAPASGSTSWSFRLLLVALVAAAGFAFWKRRNTKQAGSAELPHVRVLGRSSVSMRGEVALIEAGGTRLVIGVTPSSITTLAVLPDAPEAETAEEAEAEAAEDRPRSLLAQLEPARSLTERARAILERRVEAARTAPAATKVAAARYAESAADDEISEPPPKKASQRPVARASEAPRAEARESLKQAAGKEPRERDAAPLAKTEERVSDRPPRKGKSTIVEGQARGLLLALGGAKR